jgi:hypothetical protein
VLLSNVSSMMEYGLMNWDMVCVGFVLDALTRVIAVDSYASPIMQW